MSHPTGTNKLIWRTLSDCDNLPIGSGHPHAHCLHGHGRDCPDPGECEYVWPSGFEPTGVPLRAHSHSLTYVVDETGCAPEVVDANTAAIRGAAFAAQDGWDADAVSMNVAHILSAVGRFDRTSNDGQSRITITEKS